MTMGNEKLLVGYKLLKEYPLQKIGDIARLTTAGLVFEKTNNILIPSIAKTDFFAPVYFDKKEGDEVMIKAVDGFKIGVIDNIKGENVTIKVFGNRNNKRVLHYSKIYDKISYYHFNSLLQPCLTQITSKNKVEEMQERILLGNYFETKEECQLAIKKIKDMLLIIKNTKK